LLIAMQIKTACWLLRNYNIRGPLTFYYVSTDLLHFCVLHRQVFAYF